METPEAPVADPIELRSAAKAYKNLSHQNAAWQQLQERLRTNDPEALREFAELFRADPPDKGTASPSPGRVTNPLKVPYFPQLDNGPEGWRQCQTSAIAMCLAYLGTPNIKDDTNYLKVVQRYGDTISQQAHILALKALGVRARFRQNMTQGELLGELKGGYPVAIGILHHGPVSAPKGGGHYITVIGHTDSQWIVHDPFGELDLVNGGWAKRGGTSGKALRYSFRNTNPRWLCDGPSSGWGWSFS